MFTDVNECVASTNPCSENGKCINLLGSFRCECSEGWEGLTCEISKLTSHADINQKTYEIYINLKRTHLKTHKIHVYINQKNILNIR